jgi:hypothetical protein
MASKAMDPTTTKDISLFYDKAAKLMDNRVIEPI